MDEEENASLGEIVDDTLGLILKAFCVGAAVVCLSLGLVVVVIMVFN